MRSTYFINPQGVFCARLKDNPWFILNDDTFDESESENEEDCFFKVTNTKRCPWDKEVFLIYESELLELIKYCMWCGNMLTS